MGMEDHLMVIDLPMTELITDDMDIGAHMEIPILDGKSLPRERASVFLCLVWIWMTFLPVLDRPKFHDGDVKKGLKLLLQVTMMTPILGPVEINFGHDRTFLYLLVWTLRRLLLYSFGLTQTIAKISLRVDIASMSYKLPKKRNKGNGG